jgi:putative phage-type endonuclease
MTISKTKDKKGPTIHGFQKDLPHDQWLKWRRSGIGGSDAGVALGCHPYKSPLDLYLDKIAGVSDFTGNTATEWGHRLEPVVIEAARDAHPDICGDLAELPLLSHADRPWQQATTDMGILCGKMGPGGIEAKTALSFFSAQAYQNGKIPPHHRAQCLHYMAVTGCQFWILAALTEGPRFYTHIIERDEAEIEWLNEKETRLWEAMQSKDLQYLIDGTEHTSRALLKLYPEPEERPPAAVIDDAKIAKALEVYETSKAIEKAASEDKREAENTIKGAMGCAEEATIGGRLVSWKYTARGRRFTVKKEK